MEQDDKKNKWPVAVSRRWMFLLSVFILVNTILFGIAIYTQVIVTGDLHVLVSDMHEHVVVTKSNTKQIIDGVNDLDVPKNKSK